MFTSQAEYRLLLRADNADQRLMDYGARFGLVTASDRQVWLERRETVERERTILGRCVVPVGWPNNGHAGTTRELPPGSSLLELLRRPELSYEDLLPARRALAADGPEPPGPIESELLEIDVKYEGYVERQKRVVGRLQELEDRILPEDFLDGDLPGLSREAIEKLRRVRPMSIGQASRVPGVSPADVSVLVVLVEKQRRSGSPS
jgi:tRNA uridine 5-carboxymethylaminomethyl modification enzyme